MDNILFALLFFLIGMMVGGGYYLWESEESRRWNRHYGGEKCKLERTGYDERVSVAEGRPMYFCHYCERRFNEKKEELPKCINEILDIKEMAGDYEWAKSRWELVKKYVEKIIS